MSLTQKGIVLVPALRGRALKHQLKTELPLSASSAIRSYWRSSITEEEAASALTVTNETMMEFASPAMIPFANLAKRVDFLALPAYSMPN